jgi:hypothetical protein
VAEGRKAGQLIPRGQNRWMVRVYLGVDPGTRDLILIFCAWLSL